MEKREYEFAASCTPGLEELLKQEIIRFKGRDIHTDSSIVKWTGDLRSGYKACLWSRYSSKILLHIDQFFINDDKELYSKSKNIPWTDHLSQEMTISVSATLSNDPVLTNSHYAALKLKDAIVDYFREKEGLRPSVKKSGADFQAHLHISGKCATVYIDFSGESLHRRGYRKFGGLAPLKETLAAAIVSLSGWDDTVSSDTVFVDPMCGSGTILIEAAMMWGKQAPGLSRKKFGFLRWKNHDEGLWSEIINKAVSIEEERFDKPWPTFFGYDSDPEMVRMANENIRQAGLEKYIVVRQSDIGAIQPSFKGAGFCISNLPFGERIYTKKDIGFLYNGIGITLRHSFPGWQCGLLLTETDLIDKLSIVVETTIKLFNGPLLCRLLVGKATMPEGFSELGWQRLSLSDNDGGDFHNRLIKNLKKLDNWRKKERVSCYRVYDRDLPDYNVSIDVYEGRLLVQEFVNVSVSKEKSEKKLQHILWILRSVFQIGRDRIFLKRRQRQRGKNQYQKTDDRGKFFRVSEGKCCFLVNFTSYLDTGLFLDHRRIRQHIGDIAQGKKLLNLFGYTGSVTVHAILGGAVSTTTVDLSPTYLEWARNNLLLNGIDPRNHRLIQGDCLPWMRQETEKYDIIFIDPPTFSNTKKKNRVFNVQNDHGTLIHRALELLKPRGSVLFSTNYKGFSLDPSIFQRASVVEITSKTLSLDFYQKKKAHRCWHIEKMNDVCNDAENS